MGTCRQRESTFPRSHGQWVWASPPEMSEPFLQTQWQTRAGYWVGTQWKSVPWLRFDPVSPFTEPIGVWMSPLGLPKSVKRCLCHLHFASLIDKVLEISLFPTASESHSYKLFHFVPKIVAGNFQAVDMPGWSLLSLADLMLEAVWKISWIIEHGLVLIPPCEDQACPRWSTQELAARARGHLHKRCGCIWRLAHTSQGSDHQLYYNELQRDTWVRSQNSWVWGLQYNLRIILALWSPL